MGTKRGPVLPIITYRIPNIKFEIIPLIMWGKYGKIPNIGRYYFMDINIHRRFYATGRGTHYELQIPTNTAKNVTKITKIPNFGRYSYTVNIVPIA